MSDEKRLLINAFEFIMANYKSSDFDKKLEMSDDVMMICRELDEFDAELSSEMEARFRRMANV